MRLAGDDITIRLGRETTRLRPTLRAALRLERRHGGFDRIVTGILDGNLTIIADVIRETAITPTTIPAWLTEGEGVPIRRRLDVTTVPALLITYGLAGVDLDEGAPAQEKQDQAKKITFGEFHLTLYRQATGWLGWTPDQAWNATPAEIIEATIGRQELLSALFGGEKTDEPQLSLDEKFRAAFDKLGTKKPRKA